MREGSRGFFLTRLLDSFPLFFSHSVRTWFVRRDPSVQTYNVIDENLLALQKRPFSFSPKYLRIFLLFRPRTIQLFCPASFHNQDHLEITIFVIIGFINLFSGTNKCGYQTPKGYSYHIVFAILIIAVLFTQFYHLRRSCNTYRLRDTFKIRAVCLVVRSTG